MTTYQIEGSKDKLSLDKLYKFLLSKGYRGAKGPFFMSSFVRARGRKLYEISGNKRYEVGR